MTRSMATAAVSDWELLFAWRDGDADAGERLLTRYFEVLTRFFYNKVSSEDVGDLVSDTFLACVSSKDRMQDTGRFRSLLFGIAMNKLRNYYRTQNKRRRESSDFAELCVGEAAIVTPSAFVAQRQEIHVLVRALRRLSLVQQTVVELNVFEGMRGPEIAELLAMPLPTVYTHLRRGRKRLGEIVKELARDPQLAQTTMMGLETWATRIRAQINA